MSVRVTPGQSAGIIKVLSATSAAGKAAEIVQVGKRGVEVQVGKTAYAVNTRGKVEPAV